MGQTQDEIESQLKALRSTYSAQLATRIAEIEQGWRSVLQPSRAPAALEDLKRKLHSMAGSAGTFGLPSVGQQARQIERRIQALSETEHIPAAEQRDISARIARLKRLSEDATVTETSVPAAKQSSAVTSLIYLFEEDPEHSFRLAEKLTSFGYRVACFAERGSLSAALAQNRPLALIMDFRSDEVQAACTRWLNDYQQTLIEPLPILFMAPNAGFDARLSAVRAGGYAYFMQPADLAAMLDRLEAISEGTVSDPYRVLIVEDDQALAEHYALVLKQQGIQVSMLHDPSEILQRLETFPPDVILIDLYMPQCDGAEVASLIRQDNAFVSTPIVFLSAETDPDKQFQALMTGADDFLTKPIQDRHLISVVKSRAQRARVLENAMSRDSLTGLLKHTKVKEQLMLEVQRSMRNGSRIGFAMLDIDHFKQVNDRYGHPAGDRVIKNLAFVLRQRLRGTDLIGRYGGEEFAVILPGADTDGARAVLDDIRQAFQALEFEVEQQKFRVTLSAGIVTCARCEDPGKLIDAADDALYEAKEAGRNRVVVRTI